MARVEQVDPSAWGGELEPLAADVDRVARRLRELTEARLRRPLPRYGTVAAAGRRLAQELADLAAAAEAAGGADRQDCRVSRPLPELRDTAVGDQVAVTGHDLLRALAALRPDAEIRTLDGARRAADVVAAAHELTRTVKLAVN